MFGKKLAIRGPWVWAIAGATILAVGFGIGYGTDRWVIIKGTPTKINLRSTSSQYTFIDPLLACKSPDKSLFSEYKGLKSKISSAVSQEIGKGNISSAGVYFRDLQTGQWTGVNEDDSFYPASLLKVPVMMVLLKEAQTNPTFLNQKVVYKQTSSTNDTPFNSSTSTGLKFGSSYTVNQLIEAMIVDSDNNAKDLLKKFTDVEVLANLFNVLDIPVPYEGSATETSYGMSARQYSLFLRVLYNATFLNTAMSEKALELLSRTTFTDGLVAGLPTNIKAVHKFGIYNIPKSGKQLHDCGIVYDALHPYLACVMTQGDNYDNMKASIAKISSAIYNDF
jgi:beta-lactamase class A